MRYADYCDHHWGERLRRAAREQAQREFDRQADIVAEGIRRAGCK